MPLQLMMCRYCARSRPDVYTMITRLARAHPSELEVIELECMAACDDVPAVMIDTDYFPRIHATELEHEVLARLRAAASVPRE